MKHIIIRDCSTIIYKESDRIKCLYCDKDMRYNFRKTICIIVAIGILITLLQSFIGCDSQSEDNIGTNNTEYFEEPEEYAILLSYPAQNQRLKYTDSPPIFCWTVQKGVPQVFIVEIKYSDNNANILSEIRGGNTYLLPEEDWKKIKNYAPIIEGMQKISWRIRIDYTLKNNELIYYSEWTHFWIIWE